VIDVLGNKTKSTSPLPGDITTDHSEVHFESLPTLPRPGGRLQSRLGPLQGYLACKKTHSPRTLPYAYAQGPRGFLGSCRLRSTPKGFGVCDESGLTGLTQTPQQSHPLSPSLCTGEPDAIRKRKCFICSPCYGRACRWAMLGEL